LIGIKDLGDYTEQSFFIQRKIDTKLLQIGQSISIRILFM